MPFSPAIEACRVPDDQLAAAYEATSAEHRSWIKTTLALIGSLYPALPAHTSTCVENPAAGFACTRTSETAPWAVLLIGDGYASAIRLAAAIMPARLAGVEPILAVWTGTGALPEAVTAALELTGVEQVFAMPDARPLLHELRGRGRILCFNAALPETGLPAWSDHAPRLERAALPGDALWAHPDALPAAGGADALCEGQTGMDDVPLVLGPGLEGCWVHQDLTPAFFMNDTLRLTLAEVPEAGC